MTNSCLVNLSDVTLAGEDASSLGLPNRPQRPEMVKKTVFFGPDQNIVGQRGENGPFVAGVEVGKYLVIAL